MLCGYSSAEYPLQNLPALTGASPQPVCDRILSIRGISRPPETKPWVFPFYIIAEALRASGRITLPERWPEEAPRRSLTQSKEKRRIRVKHPSERGRMHHDYADYLGEVAGGLLAGV